ncbi:hypothetical protein [Chromohalobacter sp. 296-RDG]|uniref:hypothetical protein n=1 Tax=Chromohalobacter sp. 296-RDG TaxID=2994062 RepID=UPI0024694E04|nr:hypothetical protein [Chromohalobacter sp. 296-RDG]
MTGPSTKPLSEKLAERRAQQMDELDDVTRKQLSEHEKGLQALLSDARSTTEAVIRGQSERLTSALSEAETQQRQQIEGIEQRLASAAAQAERLSRVGGLRSWTRPVAITLAVMLAVGGVTAGGLAIADRLIDSRIQQLATLRDEIQRAESLPRLGDHLEVRTIQGETYLVGEAWKGHMDDGTPVVSLTKTKD